MTYGYKCLHCKKVFEVIKSMKDSDRNENCPRCGEFAVRDWSDTKIYVSGAKVTHAEYNPGLGCVVKNEAHKKDILKRKGLVEVGNDYGSGEKMVASADKERAEKFKKRYDDI